jgi:spoIIIJ-associated protein
MTDPNEVTVVETDDAAIETDALPIDVGDLVADYVETLLDISDLDGDIEIDEQDGRTYVTVTSDDPADLRVLANGEVVSALQELARLVVQTQTGEFARLVLDIGGTRDERSRELAELVRKAAAELAGGAERVEVEPMSSYERKLVHDLVAEHGLASHSEGEGGARHTVITSV